MNHAVFFGICLVLAGCAPQDSSGSGSGGGGGGGGTGSGTGTGAESLDLNVLSPADGAVVMEGDLVTLQVGAKGGIDGASWSILGVPSWAAEGNPVDTTELPVGALVLKVEAWSGQSSAQATVSVTVEPRVPVSYAGGIDAWAALDSPYWTADGPCVGPLDFVWDVDDSLSGLGGCTADLDGYEQPVDFVLTGRVDGGAVSGTLSSDLAAEGIVFEGSVDEDGSITCDFDQTWAEGDGSLRIWGSFTASP